ncbi:protein hipA [Escherichia coli]|uniref:Protein hipA n=1 Tax=Escherichia coli TaxID=562 RepID=A0A377E3L9_ECOLX|nr:protein hipA [Escherichia coli]
MMSFQKIYSPTQLANAMKLVRQQNGWTQSELAKKIGIKQATISNFENNPDNTTLTTFFKILQSLELSMTLCDAKKCLARINRTAKSGVVMPKLVTWMNNQRVGELTKLANGAHTFKYAPEWLASRYARPLSLSLPLQRGNITSDAVFNFFDNLLPDSPIVRDRIVKRYHAKSRQPFDLLSEIGRDSVGAVTLIPEDETVTHPIMAWEKLTEARLEEVLTAYKADIPLGMIREENDFRISVAGAQEKTALLRIGN